MGHLFKFIGTGDEIRFTIDLDHGTDTPGGMDIGLHQSLAGSPSGFLLGFSQPFFLEYFQRFIYIAFTFEKDTATVHYPGPGLGTQVFNHIRRDFQVSLLIPRLV